MPDDKEARVIHDSGNGEKAKLRRFGTYCG